MLFKPDAAEGFLVFQAPLVLMLGADSGDA
jgi:hypothetical protein